MGINTLEKQVNRFARIRMAHLPSAIEPLDNLSRALGGPRIFVKRDDQIGLGIGGNKTRKLEFLLGEAVRLGKKKVVTFGGLQSNHARQTAAAARKVGLEPILFLFGDDPGEYPGNLLLDLLAGATIHFTPMKTGVERLEEAIERMREMALEFPDVSEEDTYIIPVGGGAPVGLLGYLNAALEIQKQAEEMDIRIDHVAVAAGTGGTVAGLMAGFRLLGSSTKVVGIDVGSLWVDFRDSIAKVATRTGRQIDPGISFSPDDVTLYTDYVGEGYAIPSEGCIEAIGLLARYEGLFIDPVYTGKAMAGLIDLVRKGTFGGEETVLFLHTGGLPALFAKGDIILKGLNRR